MHIVLGATGHVGGAAVKALLARREPVTAVVRDAAKGESLRAQGAEIAVADVRDPDGLRAVLRRGRRAFLLNPPADPATDTDAEEHASVQALLAALDGSGLEHVVAQSVSGARRGRAIGDLGVLFALEEGLRAQPVPATIIRAPYYMSNWDASLKSAREEGVVHTLFPVDFRLPMAAPEDLGQAAARLLAAEAPDERFHYVEGPERYSSIDVAAAFAESLGQPITAVETPPDKWKDSFRALGFSDAAAESYAGMTKLAVEGQAPPAADVERGTITLRDYIASLVRRA